MNHLKIWFHFTGVAPEGDIFSNITLLENSALIVSFTPAWQMRQATPTVERMYLETLVSLLFHFSLTFPDRSNPDYNNLLLCAFGALHFWLWDSTLIHLGRSIDTMMHKPISGFFSKLPVSFAMKRQPPTSSIPGDLSEVFK